MSKSGCAFVIDIEASGLMQGSYPVEVALHQIGGEHHAAWLIRPESEWKSLFWDENAELLHGISRHEAKTLGIPARDVCRMLREFLADGQLYSDAHFYDQQWLDRLLEAEWPPGAPLNIEPVVSLVPTATRADLEDALETLDRPHRAGPDAEAIAALVSRLLVR